MFLGGGNEFSVCCVDEEEMIFKDDINLPSYFQNLFLKTHG